MTVTLDQLTNALIELRTASAVTNPDHPILEKYNVLLTGNKTKTMHSGDFLHVLKNHFGITATLADVHALLPQACANLKMECTPLINLSDVGKPDPEDSQYLIELL